MRVADQGASSLTMAWVALPRAPDEMSIWHTAGERFSSSSTAVFGRTGGIVPCHGADLRHGFFDAADGELGAAEDEHLL